jgi:hypothetical protein
VIAALRHLRQKYPNKKIYVAGFSLSGTMLLNTLAVYPKEMNELIDCAMPISAPVDLECSSIALDHWSNWNYNIFYTYFLKQHADLRARKYKDLHHPDVSRVKSLREFDQVYTAKVGGFKDRLDYYTTWSPNRHAEKIETETHVLLAHDDPIVPRESIKKFKPGDSVKVYETKSGGHLGYIAKSKSEFEDHRWMDTFIFARLGG